MGELRRLTAAQAARAVRAGDCTPAELERDVRAAIAARDGELRCYAWLAPPGEEAGAADAGAASGGAARTAIAAPAATLPLAGVPGALKANMATRGEPTDCGSRLLAGYRPPYDATIATRLRAAGARLLGKTNMDEFAMGSSTEHSAHGPTRNPWDPRRTPGGSSGGAAAAVAADLAFFALGSDTGGSIRQPAHCCGVVGLKPTYGRVSRYGLVAFASSLDQIGPLTKDVTDCALVYAAIAGHDPRDATSLDAPVGDPVAAAARPARGLRIGVPYALLAEGLDSDVAADFASTLADLRAAGATVQGVDLPTLPHAIATYYVICTAEASANLARFDGVRYGARAGARHDARHDPPGDARATAADAATAAADYAAMVAATRTAGFGAEVKLRILLGTHVLSAGYHERHYLKALRARALLRDDFRRAFAACDAVALPTAPTAAFPLGERTADPLRMYLSDVFTVPASLTGLPAITVPTGLDRDGLPLSLQLVGPPLGEETLLTLAGETERARGFRARKEAAWNTKP